MDIRQSLGSGFSRALKSWKGIAVVWLCTVIPVMLLVIPFRSALSSGFGRSMITDSLAGGLDIRVFADLGASLKSLTSFLSSGFVLLIFISFVLNAFLTAGLFDSLKIGGPELTATRFFSSASGNFRSFLFISFIVALMILFLFVAVVIVPTIIISSSGSLSERNNFLVTTASVLVMILLLPVLLIIADTSRAVRTSDERRSGYKSLEAGINLTFNRFRPSYFIMLVIVFCQNVFGAAAFYLISLWKPMSWRGVFLWFIASQVIIFMKIFLKTWRYGSITALFDR